MKTIMYIALAATSLIAAPAVGQSVPAAKIAIVDLERVGRDCNACKTASAALQAQVKAWESRRATLAAQLQPERTALEAAIKALGNKEPDAALRTRAEAFQKKEVAAQQELGNQQQQIQRNQAYIGQQVNARLQPLLKPAMQKRGANVLLDSGATVDFEATLDITNDVLTALNAALPSVVTTAPAAPANKQQPQGR